MSFVKCINLGSHHRNQDTECFHQPKVSCAPLPAVLPSPIPLPKKQLMCHDMLDLYALEFCITGIILES